MKGGFIYKRAITISIVGVLVYLKGYIFNGLMKEKPT